MAAPIRIGILGAAGIAPKAIIQPASESADVEIVAVAARSLERAKAFAEEHQIATVHSSYEELLADENIDAVYIPLPNAQHGPWTLAALKAGKHVLVEKPFARNTAEARSVAAEAAHYDLVVMEAFHYRYHELISTLKGLLAEGAIGRLTDVSASFDGFLADQNDIRYQYDLAGGSTMDLGCYSVHFVRTIVGEEPKVVSAVARGAADSRVDIELTGELVFPSGVTSTVSSSMLAPVQRQAARLIGTQGTILVSGFVAPQGGLEVQLLVGSKVSTIEVAPTPSSYAQQLTAFVEAIREGHPVLTDPADAIANMEVLDGLYLAAGLPLR